MKAALVVFGLCACGPALAQSYAAPPQDSARSAPLRDVPANVRTQPLASGEVTHQAPVQVAAGQAAVTVRSIQPSSVDAAAYRLDFDALDTDGDGTISRDEAQASPALAEEFDALDGTRRGRLTREQLRGWLK